MENWKAIPGFEGVYEVSDLGRVQSLDRVTYRRFQRGGRLFPARFKGRVLRPGTDTHGYHMVNLWGGGEKRVALVHHLVLCAFVGPKPVGLECRHLDGYRTNNLLSNLVWGTALENSDDKKRHGTVAAPRGEAHGLSKLTTPDVLEIRRSFSSGVTTRELARQFGISEKHARNIGRKQAWGWLE